MAQSNRQGLLVLFDRQLRLSWLSNWSIEIATIRVYNRSYHSVLHTGLIYYDWLVSRDGAVLGLDFDFPKDSRNAAVVPLEAFLGSLRYVNMARYMNVAWFSDKRWEESDPEQTIHQDFAAALYRDSETDSWGLAVNIDWLPEPQRNRLKEPNAEWFDAECEPVERGAGSWLGKELCPARFYALRGWFGSLEGH
jgi:hypothetical protein